MKSWNNLNYSTVIPSSTFIYFHFSLYGMMDCWWELFGGQVKTNKASICDIKLIYFKCALYNKFQGSVNWRASSTFFIWSAGIDRPNSKNIYMISIGLGTFFYMKGLPFFLQIFKSTKDQTKFLEMFSLHIYFNENFLI